MATVFQSSTITAEMEADTVKEILDSNGVPAIVTGLDTLPGAHDVVIQVAEAQQQRAEQLIAEALEAGADYLVIGRQVTRAADPAGAVSQIREEIRFALTAQ